MSIILTANTQSRKWQITINNPADHGYPHSKIIELVSTFKSIVYWCMADEIGEEGTYHTHVFLCSKSGIRFSSLKKKFPAGHFEICKGTSLQNKQYIEKSGKWAKDKKGETCVPGTFEEFGDLPMERKDTSVSFEDIYDMLDSGSSVIDVVQEFPTLILQMDKLEFARQSFLREKYKDTRRDVKVAYLYGASRTGKTRSVMDYYGYSNVYRVTDYKHPFDSYNGQDVVVFEEFRSSLSLSYMLMLLDCYPVELRCRYANKVALFSKVYIISNIPLIDQYKDTDVADLDAFYHRIHKVRHFLSTGVKDYDIQFIHDGFRLLDADDFIPF